MSAPLTRVEPETVAKVVRAVAPHFPQVLAVLLIGSAGGEMRPSSDIDLALVLRPPLPTEREILELEVLFAEALPRFSRHPWHVTALSGTDPRFALRAAETGRTVFVADEEAYTDWLVELGLTHLDLEESLRAFDAGRRRVSRR